MIRFTKSVLMVTLLAAFTGCSGIPVGSTNPSDRYPFRHTDFDFKVAWKISQAGQGIVADGILKNVRYFQVGDIQLWVKVLTKDNKVMAEGSTLFFLHPLGMDEYQPFNVRLDNVKLNPGDLLTFVIQYRVLDDRRNIFSWLSSFTVDAMTGVAPAKEGTNPGEW
jgi:hypothetical protein